MPLANAQTIATTPATTSSTIGQAFHWASQEQLRGFPVDRLPWTAHDPPRRPLRLWGIQARRTTFEEKR